MTELQPAEYALMIGLLKGPSYFDPRRYAERARQRRDLVLRLMFEQHLLDKAQYESAVTQPVSVIPRAQYLNSGYAAYIDAVKKELRQLDIKAADKEQGIKVFTYLDTQAQYAAETAVQHQLAKLDPELQAAVPIKTNTIRLASDATSKPDALKPATAPKTQQSPKPAKQRPTPAKIAPSPVKKPAPPKTSALTQKTIPETKAEPSAPKISASSLLARSLSMARTTPLDELEPAPLGQRIKRLQGSRYNSALENSYLMHWREKVQRIGAINYPESARRQKLSGQLRLLVSLNADGTLDEVAILSPSEYPELDQAAIRIVQLSAPFRPFPVEMRKTTDRLEIIRVWKFENDTVVY